MSWTRSKHKGKKSFMSFHFSTYSVWNLGLFEWTHIWHPGNGQCFLDQIGQVKLFNFLHYTWRCLMTHQLVEKHLLRADSKADLLLFKSLWLLFPWRFVLFRNCTVHIKLLCFAFSYWQFKNQHQAARKHMTGVVCFQ